jgi:hypothetical protein
MARALKAHKLVGWCVALFLASCQGEHPTKPTPQSGPPPASNGRRLAPIDEASKDPSFLKFRDELLMAVDRKGAKHLLSILDPGIKNSFGGDGGIDEFKAMWKPERADSEVWMELRFILTHGGAFNQTDDFVAPYVFSSFPDLRDVPNYDEESYSYGAVIEDNVILRSKPETNASAVARLSYHVVKSVDESGLPPDWIKVATTDGMTGYISRSLWRSVIDYRAFFTKQSGTWRLNMLAAGD